MDTHHYSKDQDQEFHSLLLMDPLLLTFIDFIFFCLLWAEYMFVFACLVCGFTCQLTTMVMWRRSVNLATLVLGVLITLFP